MYEKTSPAQSRPKTKLTKLLTRWLEIIVRRAWVLGMVR